MQSVGSVLHLPSLEVLRRELGIIKIGAWETAFRDGADVHHADGEGKTAIHYAARAGSHEMIEVLLMAYGADPNVSDNFGVTPIGDADYWAMKTKRSGSEDAYKFAKAIRLQQMYGGQRKETQERTDAASHSRHLQTLVRQKPVPNPRDGSYRSQAQARASTPKQERGRAASGDGASCTEMEHR